MIEYLIEEKSFDLIDKSVTEAMEEYAREMCKQQRVICANRVPTMQVTGELYNMIYNNIRNCENPIDGYIEQNRPDKNEIEELLKMNDTEIDSIARRHCSDGADTPNDFNFLRIGFVRAIKYLQELKTQKS